MGSALSMGQMKKHVGEVPKNTKGLYRVEHEGEQANSVVETLTLHQLHCRMGHISPAIAQKLIKDGFVTGMRLESMPSGELHFCESCTYAKAIWPCESLFPRSGKGTMPQYLVVRCIAMYGDHRWLSLREESVIISHLLMTKHGLLTSIFLQGRMRPSSHTRLQSLVLHTAGCEDQDPSFRSRGRVSGTGTHFISQLSGYSTEISIPASRNDAIASLSSIFELSCTLAVFQSTCGERQHNMLFGY